MREDRRREDDTRGNLLDSDGRKKTDLTRVQIESHMLHGMVRSLKIVDENYVLVARE